jgi:uncharacterized protein (DUF1778 family)
MVARRRKKKRDANLNIRCTPEEKAELDKAAETAGSTTSSFVRMAALKEARRKNGNGA